MSSVLIIPAWNESTRITPVIETALSSNTVEDIVVVDDGSIDTYDVALMGKGETLQTGYEHAKELGATTLLFIDADLIGLTSDHIDSLVTPVVEGESPMTIGILERTHMQKVVLSRCLIFQL